MNIEEIEINHLFSLLHQIGVNLKKAPYRRYLRSTVRKKQNLAKYLFEEINAKLVLNEVKINQDHLNFFIKASRFEFAEISEILKIKLANSSSKLSFKSVVIAIIFNNRLVKIKGNKMVFDIKTATSIVQTYDGAADNLDTFADAANLLKDYIGEGELETAIRFLKTRLTGKARLGLAEHLNTIDAIVDDVKARCAEQLTPDNILAKLKGTKQNNDTNSLCDEINLLANKLKSVYVGQGIPDEVAKSMATKAGVDALINGSNSFETKLILKAGNFKTIQEAVQKVREHTPTTQSNNQNSTQVMAYGAHRYNNFGRNNRGRRGNTRGGYSNNTYNSRDRNQPNFRNDNPNRYQNRNQTRYNNNGYYYSNNNNNYNRGGRRDSQPRPTYTIHAEQQPIRQNMPDLLPQQSNQQQPMNQTATTPQNFNFLYRGGQMPTPPQQYIP